MSELTERERALMERACYWEDKHSAVQMENDRLREEGKDYAALLVKHHAEEARFLQMRAEVVNLRKALEDVQSHLEQQRYYSALKTVENALFY